MQLTIVLFALFAAVAAQTLTALSGNNLIYTFTNALAAQPSSSGTIQGLQDSGETILSIAQYPTNAGNYLYGLSSSNKIYFINGTAARYISTLAGCAPADKTNPTLSIDFNPTNGNLTVLTLVRGATTNLYLANATTGACTLVAPVTLADGTTTPKPAGVLFVLNNGAANSFTLETLNNNLDSFSSTAGGLLNVIGSLGSVQFSGVGGFSYSYANNLGIATLFNNSALNSNLYTVNAASGAVLSTGNLNITTNLLGLAVQNAGSYPTNGLTTNPAPGFGGNGNGNAATTTVYATTTVNTNAATTTVYGTTTVNTNAATTTVGNTNARTTTVTRTGSGVRVAVSVGLLAAVALAL